MYITVTFLYPWDWGITVWYQNLSSHLMWITTYINSWALTNGTTKFRLELICIRIWGFHLRVQECHFVENPLLDSFYSLISVVNQNILISFSLFLHPIDSNLLFFTHDTSSLPRVRYRYQSGAAEASLAYNIQVP